MDNVDTGDAVDTMMQWMSGVDTVLQFMNAVDTVNGHMDTGMQWTMACSGAQCGHAVDTEWDAVDTVVAMQLCSG